MALGGHVAAVSQIVIPGAELINVDIDGAGIHLHLGAGNLYLFGRNWLFDAGIGRKFLHGNALFLAAFGAALRLRGGLFLRRPGFLFGGLGLRGGLFLRRLFRFRLRGFGFLGRLFAGSQVFFQAVNGRLTGQGFQQAVDLGFLKCTAGLAGLAGQGGDGIDRPLGGDAKVLGDIGNFILKIHRLILLIGSDSSHTAAQGLLR